MKRCDQCAHWDEWKPNEVGWCRRYPPVPTPHDPASSDYNWAYWPVVPADTSCGEFVKAADAAERCTLGACVRPEEHGHRCLGERPWGK